MNINIRKNVLHRAEILCAQRNVRLTPHRLEVLRLISQQNNPVSAYNLLNLLQQSSPQAKPITIYRALSFLLTQGFIHRVESTNSFILCCYFPELLHTFIFFICDYCGQVDEQKTEGIKNTLNFLAYTKGFQISSSMVELHGCCLECKIIK